MSSRRWRIALLTAALFLAENAIGLLWPGRVPPLVLLAVVFFAMGEGAAFGTALGLASGFAFELYGTGKIGPHLAAFAACGALGGAFANRLFRDSFLTQFFVAPIAYAAWAAATVMLSNSLFRSAGFEGVAFGDVFSFGTLAAATLSAPFFFALLKRAEGR